MPEACQELPTLAKKSRNCQKGLMKWFFVLLLSVAACNPKEEQQEPDYDHMVMDDADEEGWTTGDRKEIAGELPDPQESIILDLSDKTSGY